MIMVDLMRLMTSRGVFKRVRSKEVAAPIQWVIFAVNVRSTIITYQERLGSWRNPSSSPRMFHVNISINFFSASLLVFIPCRQLNFYCVINIFSLCSPFDCFYCKARVQLIISNSLIFTIKTPLNKSRSAGKILWLVWNINRENAAADVCGSKKFIRKKK